MNASPCAFPCFCVVAGKRRELAHIRDPSSYVAGIGSAALSQTSYGLPLMLSQEAVSLAYAGAISTAAATAATAPAAAAAKSRMCVELASLK